MPTGALPRPNEPHLFRSRPSHDSLHSNTSSSSSRSSDEHQDSDRRPLIRSRSSLSLSSAQQQQQQREEQLSSSSSSLKLSWEEWAIRNGLHPRMWTGQTYLKAGLLVILLTAVILSLTVFRVQDRIKDILHYIDDHKQVGAILFLTFYTISCWLFLPGSLFTIGAGFLFKPMPFALGIVVLGDVLGALGTFLLGRYLFYDWVKALMSRHPKFHALDQVIQQDGWKMVVLLRLTPIPFNLITYFFSITSIPLLTLLWATALGVFPGSCLGIWIGSLLQGLSGIEHPELERKNVVVLVMNGGFIVCSILTLSLFGKRSMRKAMARLEDHQGHVQSVEEEDGDQETGCGLRRDPSTEDMSVQPLFKSRMMEQIREEERIESSSWSSSASTSVAATPVIAPIKDTASITLVQESLLMDDHEDSVSAPLLVQVISEESLVHPRVDPGSGFTRGERVAFVAIALLAIINLAIGLPLYYYFADLDKDTPP